jgi:CIC family chloride channel protein
MIANLASLFISSRLQKEPIYDALAQQDGIHLPTLKTRERAGERKVFQVMHEADQLLPGQMSVHEAAERLRSSPYRAWPVMDENSIVGIVSRTRIESALSEGKSEQTLLSVLDTLDFPHVHSDEALHVALERMSSAHLDSLPVVSRADIHNLEGIVTLRDVLESYGLDSNSQLTPGF